MFPCAISNASGESVPSIRIHLQLASSNDMISKDIFMKGFQGPELANSRVFFLRSGLDNFLLQASLKVMKKLFAPELYAGVFTDILRNLHAFSSKDPE